MAVTGRPRSRCQTSVGACRFTRARAWGCRRGPQGWMFCDGQLLSISQNTALFSLLGTMYGGDGRTTFGLPDLRGRGPIHAGAGPGLTDHVQGETGGAESHTLTSVELPTHGHS